MKNLEFLHVSECIVVRPAEKGSQTRKGSEITQTEQQGNISYIPVPWTLIVFFFLKKMVNFHL